MNIERIFVKVFYYIVLIIFILEVAVLLLGIVNNMTNTGIKGVSITDFKQLGILLLITIIVLGILYYRKRRVSDYNVTNNG